MIPLRDDVPSRTTPVVTTGLIVLNGAVFLWELGLGRGLERTLQQVAVVPALYAGRDAVFTPSDLVFGLFQPDLLLRLFFSLFLHGGFAHLFGNMLFLWIFGDNVEDRMGHGRFVVFYLLCGVLASYAHVLSDPGSRLPSIGASGAIAGVLGAYFVLYPRARVVVAWPPPLLFFLPLMQVPAFLMLGLWFLQEFFFGLGSLRGAGGQGGGVAFWAHAGGFVAGVLLVRPFQRAERRPRERDQWWDSPRYRRARYDREEW